MRRLIWDDFSITYMEIWNISFFIFSVFHIYPHLGPFDGLGTDDTTVQSM